MAERDRQFLRLYRTERIADQANYFLDSSNRYSRSAKFLIIFAGVLMFLSSLSGWATTEDWLGVSWMWNLIATVLPAISGAVVAIRAVYEFERNQSRYRRTRLDLRKLDAELSPNPDSRGDELQQQIRTLVERVEELLAAETREWRLLMAAEPPETDNA